MRVTWRGARPGPEKLTQHEGFSSVRATGRAIFIEGATMDFDYNSQKWKRKAELIKRRDGYRCRWCARYGKAVPAVVVHHIKHVDEYPELAYVNENLVSLCQACHNKAHPEKARAMRGRR